MCASFADRVSYSRQTVRDPAARVNSDSEQPYSRGVHNEIGARGLILESSAFTPQGVRHGDARCAGDQEAR